MRTEGAVRSIAVRTTVALQAGETFAGPCPHDLTVRAGVGKFERFGL